MQATQRLWVFIQSGRRARALRASSLMLEDLVAAAAVGPRSAARTVGKRSPMTLACVSGARLGPSFTQSCVSSANTANCTCTRSVQRDIDKMIGDSQRRWA